MPEIERLVPSKDFTHRQSGLHMKWVPGGTFTIGRGRKEKSMRAPVKLSPYWIGETAVTNSQFDRFIGATGASLPVFRRDP